MIVFLKRICGAVVSIIMFIYNKIRLMKSKKRIEAYHNKYVGKRCFIVGNGPSLSVDDLEHINGEISFGTHRIYKIFNETTWRPTFYFAQDYKLILDSIFDISSMNVQEKFIGMVPTLRYPRIKDACFSKITFKKFFPAPPEFSYDVSKEMFEGMTVTYMCLQFAVYMGFSEIILIGVDHSYAVELEADGTMKINEGVQNHFAADTEPVTNIPQLDKTTLAYFAAKDYANRKGVSILNATRGGKLEVFPRVEFESLFL